MSHLYQSIDFVENPIYEQIISDLAKQKFSVVEQFFSLKEVALLRQSLLEKYEEDAFKKAAIGSKLNKTIERSIRVI